MSIETIIDFYKESGVTMHFEGELRMLNRLAAGVTEGVIVAIGSYRGQSDCALALHAQVPVYAIDHREGSADDPFHFGDEDRVFWMRNVLMLGVGAKVRPINLHSTQVARIWDQEIGMLFVDGSHDYDGVMEDLNNWFPFVRVGGMIAMHDWNREGVAAAIDNFASYLDLIEEADLTKVFVKSAELAEQSRRLALASVAPGNVTQEVAPPVHTEMDAAAFEAVSSPRHTSQTPKKKTGRGK